MIQCHFSIWYVVCNWHQWHWYLHPKIDASLQPTYQPMGRDSCALEPQEQPAVININIYVIMLLMTVGNITWSNSQINVFIIELTNQTHSKSLYISIYSAHWTPSCTDAFWMGVGFQLVRFPAPFKPRFMDYDTSQYKHIYICGGSITLNSWSINHNQNLSILCIYSI